MSSIHGDIFQWKFYVNNSLGNWNETIIFSQLINNTPYTVTSVELNTTNPLTNDTLQNITSHIVLNNPDNR